MRVRESIYRSRLFTDMLWLSQSIHTEASIRTIKVFLKLYVGKRDKAELFSVQF